MFNKMIIGLMALLLVWTIFTNLDGAKEESPIDQSEEHIPIENPLAEEHHESANPSEEESPAVPQVGLGQDDLAPDFSLSLISGEEVTLSDYLGKKVILNFWATWCPPCRAEMPDMQAFYEQADEEVEILAVNLTKSEQSIEDIESFLTELGITFPILLDEESDIAAMYQAIAIPTTYFIDTKGTIQGKWIGPMNYDLMVKQIELID